jgi:hypothetical protein
MTIARVKPSLNLEGIDGSAFTFKCYGLRFANQTYLQLETLLTSFNLRFYLEHSKRQFIVMKLSQCHKIRSPLNLFLYNIA